MAFTIKRRGLDSSDRTEVADAVRAIYRASPPPRSVAPEASGDQHGYDDLTPEEIHSVLGSLASNNEVVGVYADVDDRRIGEVALFSIPRLAECVAAAHPAIARAVGDGAPELDELEEMLDELGSSTDVLAASILNAARSPIGEDPVLVIWW
jgi:hypothetical protein